MSATTKRKKKKKAKKPTFSKKWETWEEPEPAPHAHVDLSRMLKYISDSGESRELKEYDTSMVVFLACYAQENDEIIIDNFPQLLIPGTTSGEECERKQ